VAQTLPATPIISVIVATRNRRESLQQFIDGLRVLPDRPAWELIVADNGSTDGTDLLLSTIEADLPVLVVNEKQPGKSRALNKALKHARGDILLFTDDDIVPDQNWLMALHKASLEYPNANVFGGRVLVNCERIPKWIMKSSNLKTMLVSEQDFGNEICWFARDQYPIGPNLAVRRELFDRDSIGWPVNLGPGTKIPLGDERAFLVQLSPSYSRDRLYVPGSVVRHSVRGRQLSIGNALSRCFLGGYAAGLIDRVGDRASADANENALRVARRRLRELSSSREFICVLARALGVMAGLASPFARVLYG
jgi:glycosyltransferase involved in cell wall biosynthesis